MDALFDLELPRIASETEDCLIDQVVLLSIGTLRNVAGPHDLASVFGASNGTNTLVLLSFNNGSLFIGPGVEVVVGGLDVDRGGCVVDRIMVDDCLGHDSHVANQHPKPKTVQVRSELGRYPASKFDGNILVGVIATESVGTTLDVLNNRVTELDSLVFDPVFVG